MSNPGSCGGVFSLFPGASLPGVETPLPHAAPPLAHSPQRRAASSGGAAAAARKVLLGVSAGTCQLLGPRLIISSQRLRELVGLHSAAGVVRVSPIISGCARRCAARRCGSGC